MSPSRTTWIGTLNVLLHPWDGNGDILRLPAWTTGTKCHLSLSIVRHSSKSVISSTSFHRPISRAVIAISSWLCGCLTAVLLDVEVNSEERFRRAGGWPNRDSVKLAPNG
jgi:hypothetical protein